MLGVVLVQLSIQARRQNVEILYKDLSQRLEKYVYDAWDVEECDAGDGYVGILICLYVLKDYKKSREVVAVDVWNTLYNLCKRWLVFYESGCRSELSE